MKKIFILIFLIISTTIYAQSYHQFGYVKTKGSRDKAGNRIEGVRIKVKGKKGAYQTDSIGEFSIDGLERKFILERVDRAGYELLDYETIGANIEVSSEPLRIVMVDKHQLNAEKSAILNELLKEFNKRQEENRQLQIDLSNLQKSFSEMADRLARVDYDLMNEKDREIHICMEQGDYKKADSLILSKGSIQERIEYSQKGDKSILDDCYILATNAVLRNDIDSALFLLEQRTEIAPTNIECLLDAGYAYLNYQTNTKKALDFFSQALLFARRKLGDNHPITVKCNFSIAAAHFMQRNFKDAIPILHNCIGAFNVPNIPVVYERTEIDCLEDGNESGTNIIEAKDSSIVSQLYSMAMIIYGVQGNFNLAVECKNLAEKYANDDESIFMQLVSTATTYIAAGVFRQTLDEVVLPYLKAAEEEPTDIVTAEFYSFAAMCYSNLNMTDSTIIYADKIIDYFDIINQQGNQYYHLAVLSKSAALIAQGHLDSAYGVIVHGEEIFQKYGLPQPDIMVQIERTKGWILYSKGDMIGAEKTVKEAISSIVELSEENNYDYRRIKAILISDLADIYKETNRITEAKDLTRLAFGELKDLYKDIGYDHQDMIGILLQMADLEEKTEDYLEAFRSYRMIYSINESTECKETIDKCYQAASESKSFRKLKDYKILKKEYQDFVERTREGKM